MTQDELLPYGVRTHAASLVERLAEHVAAAANHEKQASIREQVESLLTSDRQAAFLLHSIHFDSKQVDILVDSPSQCEYYYWYSL